MRILETIRSVKAQTYPNWEIIIVDDCSTDNSNKVVESYMAEDGRIRFLKNDKNFGAALSRNYALREAKGRWIAFLDSDDLWEPKKLEGNWCGDPWPEACVEARDVCVLLARVPNGNVRS